MVTDGVMVGWGGTTSSSRGMDSRNKLVGDGIVEDPDNELTTDPDDDKRRVELSIDPSTDPDANCREDAGVTRPVLRRFAELARLSD
jgi:hypothetical protein